MGQQQLAELHSPRSRFSFFSMDRYGITWKTSPPMRSRTLRLIALLIAGFASTGCGSGYADDLPPPENLKPKRLPAPNPSPPSSSMDILESIDARQDSVAGIWGFLRRDLISPEAPHARLQLPALPPEEYDLNLTVTRRRGFQAFHIGVVTAGKQALFSIDGGSGNDTWLSLNPLGEPASNTTLLNEKLLPWKKSVPIRVTVRKSGVGLFVNGKNRIEWSGSPQDLALPSSLRMPEPRVCFLGAVESVFMITECSLVPVTGETRPLR